MASMFRRDPRTKITSLFREVFAEVATASPDEPMFVVVSVAAQACGIPVFDAEGIAQRLLEFAEKAKGQAEAKKPSGPRKQGSGFGVHYSKWLAEQSTERLCLWLADFDFDRARYLYCETDIDDLRVMVDVKTEYEWQVIRTHFESCVIGFGGKLEGQSDATVHEVDMSDTKSIDSMVSAMRQMGF